MGGGRTGTGSTGIGGAFSDDLDRRFKTSPKLFLLFGVDGGTGSAFGVAWGIVSGVVIGFRGSVGESG